MASRAMFSSVRQDWATPIDFFNRLDAEFGFTLDACAGANNNKVERFFSVGDDGLSAPWEGVVWCNPPYGKDIHRWVTKGLSEAARGATVVMLVPARTDTRWWHEAVMFADEIRLVRGRITFVGASAPAPFPSAVVVFRGASGRALFSSMPARWEMSANG